jgi:hypothetical protein
VPDLTGSSVLVPVAGLVSSKFLLVMARRRLNKKIKRYMLTLRNQGAGARSCRLTTLPRGCRLPRRAQRGRARAVPLAELVDAARRIDVFCLPV